MERFLRVICRADSGQPLRCRWPPPARAAGGRRYNASVGCHCRLPCVASSTARCPVARSPAVRHLHCIREFSHSRNYASSAGARRRGGGALRVAPRAAARSGRHGDALHVRTRRSARPLAPSAASQASAPPRAAARRALRARRAPRASAEAVRCAQERDAGGELGAAAVGPDPLQPEGPGGGARGHSPLPLQRQRQAHARRVRSGTHPQPRLPRASHSGPRSQTEPGRLNIEPDAWMTSSAAKNPTGGSPFPAQARTVSLARSRNLAQPPPP